MGAAPAVAPAARRALNANLGTITNLPSTGRTVSRIKYYSVSCAKGFEQPKMGDTPRAAILPTTDAAARRTRWMGHACAFACGALACAAVRPAGAPPRRRADGPRAALQSIPARCGDTVDGPFRRLRGAGDLRAGHARRGPAAGVRQSPRRGQGRRLLRREAAPGAERLPAAQGWPVRAPNQ